MEFSARRLFIETITDDSGIVIPAVTVTVYDAGTTGTIPLYYAKSGLSFTGTGDDDLSVQTPFAGSSDTQFRLKMMTGGTKFKWSDDGGTTWDKTGITITGAHLITGALVVHFTGTTGHNAGDRWDLYARPNPFVTDADGVADAFGNGDVYDEITIVLSKTDYSFTDINAALEYLPVRGIRGHTGATGASVTGPTGGRGKTGVTGAASTVPGHTGVTGASGSDGLFGGDSFGFIFCTGTSDAYHGTGSLTLNSTGFGSATMLFVDDMNADAVDIQPWLRTLTGSASAVKGRLRLFEEYDSTNFAVYDLTGGAEAADYFKLYVSKVLVNGSLSNADDVVMSFTRSSIGTMGPSGPSGPQGHTGKTGAMTATGGILTITPTGAHARDVGQIRFLELAANGTDYIALRAADSIGATHYITLPTGIGATGQALLVDSDGDTYWGSVASTLADGDKGDIVVRHTGSEWLVQTGAVSLFKLETGPAQSFMANITNTGASPTFVTVAASRILGRGASGDLAALTGGQAKAILGTLLVPDGGTGKTTGAIGGVPYYPTATTMESSAKLAQYGVVVGGGATGPATISASTTTAHALFATAGAPAFRGIATTDLASFVTQAAVTLYVAKTGNDGNAGTSGSPKLTITGALDSLPVVIAHAVIINVSPGTYTEALEVPISRLNILASLTIQGVDTSDRVWGVKGQATAGAAGTIDVANADVVNDDEWNGAYIALYGGSGEEGQVRAITDTDAANNRITVANWDTAPDASTKYILCGAVTIDGNTAMAVKLSSVRNVAFKYVCFKASGAATWTAFMTNISAAKFHYCMFVGSYGIDVSNSSNAELQYCGFLIPANGIGLYVQNNSYCYALAPVIYGAKSGDIGIYGDTDGSIQLYATEHANVRHLGTGILAYTGTKVYGTSVVYTDNTTNTSPNAPASVADLIADNFAYIEDQS